MAKPRSVAASVARSKNMGSCSVESTCTTASSAPLPSRASRYMGPKTSVSQTWAPPRPGMPVSMKKAGHGKVEFGCGASAILWEVGVKLWGSWDHDS